MKIVKRNVYCSEFKQMSYPRRFAYLWLNVLLAEIELESPLNPIDWTIRSIACDAWYIVSLYPLLTILFFSSISEAHRIKTRYSDCESSFFRDEYILD